jgi:hypothetical protein
LGNADPVRLRLGCATTVRENEILGCPLSYEGGVTKNDRILPLSIEVFKLGGDVALSGRLLSSENLPAEQTSQHEVR